MSTLHKIAIAAGALALTAGAAVADTIDFGQFGPQGATVGTPASGVTTGGVGFILVGPGDFYRDDEGSFYLGDFPEGAKTLFEATPGQAVIYFNTPISSLGTLYIAPDKYESYTATMTAYDSLGDVLGSVSYNDTLAFTPGTNPGFEIFGAGIDHVTLSTDDASVGFNISGAPTGGAVPEPATWALMLVGFGGMGAMLRRRSAVASQGRAAARVA